MGFALSPGVNVSEIDLTGYIPAVSTTGGATVGQFEWGPVEQFTTIADKKKFEKWFGKPSDTNYRDWYTAINFLGYSNNLNTIRVVEATALNATAEGSGILIKNNEHFSLVVGTPAGDTAMIASRYAGVKGDSIKISMADASTFDTWDTNYSGLFDSPPKTSKYVSDLGGSNDELHIVVIDAGGLFTGVPGAVLERFAYVSKAKDGKTADNAPNFYGDILNKQSEFVWWLEVPESADYAVGGAVTGVLVNVAGTGYTVAPTVNVTGDGSGASATAVLESTGAIKEIAVDVAGQDYTTAPTVGITGDGTGALASSTLEMAGSVKSIAVDVAGTGYTVAPTVNVTGDGSGASATAVLDATGGVVSVTVTDGGTGYTVGDAIVISGDGTGATAQVDGETAGVIDTINVTAAGSGYTSATADATGVGGGDATADATIGYGVASVTVDVAGSGYTSATVDFTGDGSGATATATLGFAVASYTVDSAGEGYSISSVTVTGDGTGATATSSIGYGVASVTVDNAGQDYTIAPTIDFTGDGTGATATSSIVAGADWDAEWNTNALNSKYKALASAWTKLMAGGNDGGAITSDELIIGWKMFENAETVDVSLLISGDAGGDASHTAVVKYIVDQVAERRKDCVAFFSPLHADVVGQPETLATANVIATRTAVNTVSSYAVMDSGWKYQYDYHNDKFRWIPLNADIAGLCSRTDDINDPWYSPAGFNRGQIKNVIQLALNPSKTSRDELYKKGVNPVVSFAGEGVLLYGDRTQQSRPSAFQKINIRRLFIVLEKAIATAAKYQLFEFNDSFTRAQFVNMVEPFLREVRGRRGIYDFEVVCDERNNTPEVIDRSEFVADIYIKPTYSINFIQLNFIAVRTGVEFEEVINGTTEQNINI